MLPPAASADEHTQLMFSITILPRDQRNVLYLFYFERLTLEEIATVLEKSEDDVAALYYTAYCNARKHATPSLPEPVGAGAVDWRGDHDEPGHVPVFFS